MIEISYNVRPFIKPVTQQVAVRVRWNKKKSETTFITGAYADPAKWDSDGIIAVKSTPQVVMKATGHKGYKTMQPYIDTATETQTLEMERWNKNQYRSQIITTLDKMSENELLLVSKVLQNKGLLAQLVDNIKGN